MSQLAFAVGLIIVLFTGASVLFTIVLPREPRGFERLSSLVNRVVQLAFIVLSRLAKTYEGKDALLAPTAPVALIAQLAVWALCFIVGYALMLEGDHPQPRYRRWPSPPGPCSPSAPST